MMSTVYEKLDNKTDKDPERRISKAWPRKRCWNKGIHKYCI